jgi:hypothetical protein
VRRWTAGVAATSFLVAIGGCAEDRGANSDPKRTPIAVTEGGVEILEVVKNERERTVEAAVVAGGEERQATFAPLLDGPLPFGVVATLSAGDGEELVQVAYGWDDQARSNWTRQQTDDDVFELMRTVEDDRVREEYTINGRTLVLEYADLAPVIASKATAEFRRGAPITSQDPKVIEFVDQLRAFDVFAAENPNLLLTTDADGQLLSSLLGDPVFARTMFGDEAGAISKSIVGALCRAFVQCASIGCRVIPASVLCGVCTAGAMACIALDLYCAWAGCGCCFN